MCGDGLEPGSGAPHAHVAPHGVRSVPALRVPTGLPAQHPHGTECDPADEQCEPCRQFLYLRGHVQHVPEHHRQPVPLSEVCHVRWPGGEVRNSNNKRKIIQTIVLHFSLLGSGMLQHAIHCQSIKEINVWNPLDSLLPDTWNWGLRMRRECRERFPRHRRLAILACITARAWSRLAILACITARAWRTCRDACRDR